MNKMCREDRGTNAKKKMSFVENARYDQGTAWHGLKCRSGQCRGSQDEGHKILQIRGQYIVRGKWNCHELGLWTRDNSETQSIVQ